MWKIENIEILISQNMILYFSFGYILIKIITRSLVRNLIGAVVDVWDIIAWFSMDIAFVNVALMFTKGISGSDDIIIYAYILFTFFMTLLILLLYGFFTRRRLNVIGSKPTNDFRLALHISMSYFLGFLNLELIYNNLW